MDGKHRCRHVHESGLRRCSSRCRRPRMLCSSTLRTSMCTKPRDKTLISVDGVGSLADKALQISATDDTSVPPS